jgi:hypothetical protein
MQNRSELDGIAKLLKEAAYSLSISKKIEKDKTEEVLLLI